MAGKHVNRVVLSPTVLGWAMRLVQESSLPRGYQMACEFDIPPAYFTISGDAFVDKVLQPLIETALLNRQPLGDERGFPISTSDEVLSAHSNWKEYGIIGRLQMGKQPLTCDQHMRLDIRVLPEAGDL
jgi:hypothetical protein